MKITNANLIRWAGLAAITAGTLFIAIQIIHPSDTLAAVTTAQWAIVHYLSIIMDLLALFGLTGIYARQAEKAAWLGLGGYVLFSGFFAITMAFQFIEAFILPLLATAAPEFVESLFGIVSGRSGMMNLGALPTIYSLIGIVGYVLGGLLFGIATVRAKVLPRLAGGLLAIAAVSVFASGLLPHPLDRILAVPMGSALIWLGLALLLERRTKTSENTFGTEDLRFHHTAGD